MLTLGKFTHRSTWEKAVLVFDGQPVILVVFLCNGPCLANYFKCDHLQKLFKPCQKRQKHGSSTHADLIRKVLRLFGGIQLNLQKLLVESPSISVLLLR